MSDSKLNPITSYGSHTLSGMITEHRARNMLFRPPNVSPTKATVKIEETEKTVKTWNDSVLAFQHSFPYSRTHFLKEKRDFSQTTKEKSKNFRALMLVCSTYWCMTTSSFFSLDLDSRVWKRRSWPGRTLWDGQVSRKLGFVPQVSSSIIWF